MQTDYMTELVPADIDGATVAFPAEVRHLMPSYDAIPKEFKHWPPENKWGQLFNDWFFSGITGLELKPKGGIDQNRALRHVSVVMRSFEPKHEHKQAACAYLMSLWFEDATWKRAERKLRS